MGEGHLVTTRQEEVAGEEVKGQNSSRKLKRQAKIGMGLVQELKPIENAYQGVPTDAWFFSEAFTTKPYTTNRFFGFLSTVASSR